MRHADHSTYKRDLTKSDDAIDAQIAAMEYATTASSWASNVAEDADRSDSWEAHEAAVGCQEYQAYQIFFSCKGKDLGTVDAVFQELLFLEIRNRRQQ